MKKLSNLKGAKALNKKEQKALNGGCPLNSACKSICGSTGGFLHDGICVCV